MNEPLQPPRMTSLDRKIEAARLRTERERAAAAPNHMPTQGLTSHLSTKEKDVPLVRGALLGADMAIEDDMSAVQVVVADNYQRASKNLLQLITQLNAQDAATGKQWEAEMLNRVQANLQMPKSVQKAIAGGVIPHPGVADAMITLRRAFKDDPDFARSWHDSLAMAVKDQSARVVKANRFTPTTRSLQMADEIANTAAAHFMRMAFDVDTGPTTLAARQNHIRSIVTDGFANRTLTHRPNSLPAATECPGCPDCEREAQKGWLARPDFLG